MNINPMLMPYGLSTDARRAASALEVTLIVPSHILFD